MENGLFTDVHADRTRHGAAVTGSKHITVDGTARDVDEARPSIPVITLHGIMATAVDTALDATATDVHRLQADEGRVSRSHVGTTEHVAFHRSAADRDHTFLLDEALVAAAIDTTAIHLSHSIGVTNGAAFDEDPSVTLIRIGMRILFGELTHSGHITTAEHVVVDVTTLDDDLGVAADRAGIRVVLRRSGRYGVHIDTRSAAHHIATGSPVHIVVVVVDARVIGYDILAKDDTDRATVDSDIRVPTHVTVLRTAGD